MEDFRQKIRNGDVEGIQKLVKKDPTIINKRFGIFGRTPLIFACREGADRRIIDILIKAGAKLGAKDRLSGWTALHCAVKGNHLRAVEILLSWGCEVNPRDDYGRTPLHLACLWGHLHIVDRLLGHYDIDVNVVANNGDTPLHEAVRGRNNELVSLLLSKGSLQLDIKNKMERTPLLEAVSQGHLGMTHLLIALGANVNAVDGEGNRCLHLAMATEKFNSQGAPLDLLNECCTALNLKMEERLSGIVVARYLASQGADLHHKNNKNNTPLDLIKDPNLRKKLETCLPPQCLRCRNKAAATKVHPCGHLVICKGCSNVPLQQCLKCLKPVITSRGRVGAPKSEDRCVKKEATCLELGAASQAIESPVLKERDLLRVAKRLGRDWWQIAIFLEVDTTELKIDDESIDTVKQGYLMLKEWFKNCDPETRTHATLSAALEEAECFAAMECLSLDAK